MCVREGKMNIQPDGKEECPIEGETNEWAIRDGRDDSRIQQSVINGHPSILRSASQVWVRRVQLQRNMVRKGDRTAKFPVVSQRLPVSGGFRVVIQSHLSLHTYSDCVKPQLRELLHFASGKFLGRDDVVENGFKGLDRSSESTLATFEPNARSGCGASLTLRARETVLMTWRCN